MPLYLLTRPGVITDIKVNQKYNGHLCEMFPQKKLNKIQNAIYSLLTPLELGHPVALFNGMNTEVTERKQMGQNQSRKAKSHSLKQYDTATFATHTH